MCTAHQLLLLDFITLFRRLLQYFVRPYNITGFQGSSFFLFKFLSFELYLFRQTFSYGHGHQAAVGAQVDSLPV